MVLQCVAFLAYCTMTAPKDSVDLTQAIVVTRGAGTDNAERTAANVLVEEVLKRTGIRWPVTADRPRTSAPQIVLTTAKNQNPESTDLPPPLHSSLDQLRPEGFRLFAEVTRDRVVIWVMGVDSRGVLFGVGQLLRRLELRTGSVHLQRDLSILTAPAYPIRGHQLGYRDRANSYDAWDDKQYEQYIRELAIFGSNAVENIPFEDRAPSPHMKLSRAEMNVRISQICDRYDLAYWVWTPADFDLDDSTHRKKALADHEALYRACPRLDAVFVPGGDPGDNHPRLVVPFLSDIAERLRRQHPRARVWLSLQGFSADKVDSFYELLNEQKPEWFGGVVAGPSSPAIAETRLRLPHQYALRHYPDITHTVRAQYPVPWWDPAYSLTLGREPINPRPLHEATIHNAFAPYTVGSISYSDGVHDDVNKTVWSRLGWDPQADVREILIEYARFYFGPDVADSAADGLLALERNWEGPLASNGGVDATLSHWRRLESENPQLSDNWRWQQCLLRAYYDAYTRHRLIYETRLEDESNAALAQAPSRGADSAIDAALSILHRAETDPCQPALRARIDDLCLALFRSIGLQTSVPRFRASGYERGCVLDFVDHPLNNRWWLEDEFAKVRLLKDEKQKNDRLTVIRTWEHPGPGSFYDDIGNVAKSPHVIRGERQNTDPNMRRDPNPGFMWWDEGRSRRRTSWISYMNWPLGLSYDGLDPTGTYVVRLTGLRQSLLRANGERLEATVDGQEIGEFKEFPIPARLIRDGKLLLTWDRPDEAQLNWRVKSRVTEVWLLKQ